MSNSTIWWVILVVVVLLGAYFLFVNREPVIEEEPISIPEVSVPTTPEVVPVTPDAEIPLLETTPAPNPTE